jgi:hypothetical protein
MYHCTSFLPCSRMGPIYKINIQILSWRYKRFMNS